MSKVSEYAAKHSRARLFVGQLEPYVTDLDIFPIFSAFGTVLYLNITRHSTNVTPNEERHIPCAFIWYETTKEADAAIAALHNRYSFTTDDDDTKKRYIQVSYADKSPEISQYGKWQKKRAEGSRSSRRNNNNNNHNHNNNNNTGMMHPSSSQWSVSEQMTPSASYEDMSQMGGQNFGANQFGNIGFNFQTATQYA